MRIPKYFDMPAVVRGESQDMRVEFDYQPEEKDVGVGVSVTITAAYRVNSEPGNGPYDDMLAKMSKEEIAELEVAVMEHICGRIEEWHERTGILYDKH